VSSDLLTLYFNGLRSRIERIPFIQKGVGKVRLRNHIADYILKKSDYRNYRWSKRKKWAVDKKNIILV